MKGGQRAIRDSTRQLTSLEPSIRVIRALFPTNQLETLEPGILTVAFSGERPTDWLANRRLVGIHGEIRQLVAEILGLAVKPVHMIWESMIPAVLERKIDLPGLGTAWTRERELTFGYTQPYQYFFFGILQPVGLVIVDFEELRDKKIAVIGESFNNPELIDVFGERNVLIYPSADAIVRDMADGRIDIAIYDFPNIELARVNHPSRADFHVLPFNFDPQHPLTTARFPNYLVFRRDAMNLRSAADLAIDLLKSSGTLGDVYASHGFNPKHFLSPANPDGKD